MNSLHPPPRRVVRVAGKSASRTLLAQAWWLVCIAAPALASCSLRHGYEPPTAPMVDAGHVDARVGGTTPVEPDLGPESRPSDYPDADGWEEPPEIGPDDPCCAMDDPLQVASNGSGSPPVQDVPLVAWGVDSWGLLVTQVDERSESMAHALPVLFEVSEDGQLLLGTHPLEIPFADTGGIVIESSSLRHSAGHWAAAVHHDGVPGSDPQTLVRLYAHEESDSGWVSLAAANRGAFDLVWLNSGAQWLGLGSTSNQLSITPLDEYAAGMPTRLTVSDRTALRAVSLRSRAVALLTQSVPGGSGSEIVVVGPGPDYGIVGRLRVTPSHPRVGTLAAVRDVVIAVAIEDSSVTAEVFDPWELRALSQQTIGHVSVPGDGILEIDRRALDAAGSSKLGVIGVCYGVPQGSRAHGAARIEFRLVGQDGRAVGTPVTVVSSHFRGGAVNCRVGANESGFLVGWWDGRDLWVRHIRVAD